MTEPRRRSTWGAFADEWDPDHEAIRRMREVLRPQDAPQRPEPSEPPIGATPEPIAAPEESPTPSAESTRRQRISDLVKLVQSGDLSAVEALRRALTKP